MEMENAPRIEFDLEYPVFAELGPTDDDAEQEDNGAVKPASRFEAVVDEYYQENAGSKVPTLTGIGSMAVEAANKTPEQSEADRKPETTGAIGQLALTG